MQSLLSYCAVLTHVIKRMARKLLTYCGGMLIIVVLCRTRIVEEQVPSDRLQSIDLGLTSQPAEANNNLL